ncbi:hypothetical protein F4Z99_06540 [Candidatus Poribacteria bacterium]|nr:hypothetical protein [Candidatus Poribacteria bacterium]MYB01160.1 hypothetical protein [Candidatus Poribacteria bacterium]
MLKKMWCFFVLLFIFGFSATLMGNEWANYYFPDTLGSYWTYEDQDGEEFTRYAIEPQDFDGETYRAFSYDPPLEDWADYRYHIHSYFYQVGNDWVAFSTGEEIENAIKALVTNKLDEGVMQPLREQLDKTAPPGVTFDISTTFEAEAQDYFYLFPTPITYNEEWDSMAVHGKFVIRIDVAGDPNEVPPGGALIFTFNYNVSEIGTVKTTETVETPAGTFEDCLKIEFQAEIGMTLETSPPMEGTQSMLPDNSKSLTTLWLAPNVGLVKMEQESENSNTSKTFELTNYEIKSTESGSGETN